MQEKNPAAVKPEESQPHQLSLDRPLHAALAHFTAGLSPAALSLGYADWAQHLLFSPDKQIELAERAALNWLHFLDYCPRALVNPNCEACIAAEPNDKRFANPSWHLWPFNAMSQGFLLTQQWWQNATTGIRGVSKHHESVVSFVARQCLDVISPANFPPTNPEVIETTFRQAGANLANGAFNLVEDWRRYLSGAKPFGMEHFEVGRNIATTPGKIIARNRLMELIQYSPATETVHAEPILIVPAWIMKYYILDLSPENSLVKYLVGKGHTVFMVSWKNPDNEDRDLDFEDYLTFGVQAALTAVTAIVPGHRVHGVGYCLGGTLMAIAAAAMARDRDDRLSTLTLFAAQTDFSEAGELMLFIDDAEVSFLEDMMAENGYLDSSQMAGALQLLRSNDLIWSRMVREYLMGERRPMFDLLAWNADATRMPARMHSTYLRRLFLNNELAGGHFQVDGKPISLRDIRVPIFAVSTISDHIAPWRSVYKIQALTDADVTFVLSNGGHNAGIVNPPDRSNRYHQIATHKESENYIDPDSWQRSAVHHERSWWPCWQGWLERHSTTRVVPPMTGGPREGYPPLAEAPGSYVLAS